MNYNQQVIEGKYRKQKWNSTVAKMINTIKYYELLMTYDNTLKYENYRLQKDISL